MLGASALISTGVLLGRVAGVARDIALASSVGAGGDADVAVIVLSLPDLLTTILIGGVVSAVLIPDFRAARALGASGRALFWRLQLAMAIAAGSVAAFVAVGAPLVIKLAAPGLDTERSAVAAPLVAVAALTLPFTGLAAVSTAYLQAHGRFAIPASGTFTYNVALVIGILLFVRPGLLLPLAVFAVLGSIVRWLMQVLRGQGIEDMGESARFGRRELPALGRRYLQALGATSLVVLVPYLARAIASLGQPGDIAVLTYAWRLVELPLGAFVTVGSIAVLPHLSELFARGDDAEATRLARSTVVATFVLTIPLTVALVWAAGPIANVLYGRGVPLRTTEQIADLARVGLLALPAQGLAAVFTVIFIARRSLRRLASLNAIALGIFLAVGYFSERLLGVVGVVLAFVVINWVLAIVLLALLHLRERIAIGGAGLAQDLAQATAVGILAFLPVALIEQASVGNAWTILFAMVGGGLALLVALIVPYRNLSAGLLVVRSLVRFSGR